MTTKGLRWRIKTRKRNARKPPSPPQPQERDPLAGHPMLPYMHEHLEWLAVHGYSADTVQSRRTAIRRFITWCDERGLLKPADVSKQVIERYQRHLFYYRKEDGKPLTAGTQMGCLAPLKLWFKWLSKENHILFNPASELDLPRYGRRLPRVVLAVQEVEAILAEAAPGDPMGLRDRALLELLYSTGLGLGLAIARQNVESMGGTLTVKDLPGVGCIFTIAFPNSTVEPRSNFGASR